MHKILIKNINEMKNIHSCIEPYEALPVQFDLYELIWPLSLMLVFSLSLSLENTKSQTSNFRF